MSLDKSAVTLAVTAAAAAAVGAAAAYAVLRAPQPAAGGRRPATHRGVHVLVVNLQLKKGGAALFKERWATLAAYCAAHEPRTLSYELSQSLEDEDKIMIFERYVEPADLEVTHRASEPFKAFGQWCRETVPDLIVSRAPNTAWTESNIGFM